MENTTSPATGQRPAIMLDDHLTDAMRRRRDAGIPEDAVTMDALRNKGDRRTESKKALLRAAAARARAAGVEPVPSYVDGILV